jgi:hypothetical protein
MDQKSIEILNKDYFPLYKVEFEDTHRFRDVDSDYLLDSEDHELLRKGHRAVIYIQEKYGDEWKVLYDDLSYDMVRASIEIEDIKFHYPMWKSQYIENPPVMFIYENQVFKQPHVMMDQFCVAGVPIEPEKYFTDEGSIKVDFFKSFVQPIPKNRALIHAEQIYFNGELLYSRRELNALGIKTYSSSSIVDFIRQNIKEATSYEAEMESGTLRSSNEGAINASTKPQEETK